MNLTSPEQVRAKAPMPLAVAVATCFPHGGITKATLLAEIRRGRLGFEKIWENGGWYRDRTCDPYHVKVVTAPYPIDLSGQTVANVLESFRIGSLSFWAIMGGERQ